MLFNYSNIWINHAKHLNTYFDASNASLKICVILWCIWSRVHRKYNTSPWHSTSQYILLALAVQYISIHVIQNTYKNTLRIQALYMHCEKKYSDASSIHICFIQGPSNPFNTYVKLDAPPTEKCTSQLKLNSCRCNFSKMNFILKSIKLGHCSLHGERSHIHFHSICRKSNNLCWCQNL